jgi:hypothetical protein
MDVVRVITELRSKHNVSDDIEGKWWGIDGNKGKIVNV